MKLNWQIQSSDLHAIRLLEKGMAGNAFVLERIARNVDGSQRPTINMESIWHALIMCLLTTQQRSGPTSPVTRFLHTKPFPLSWNKCLSASDLPKLTDTTLSEFGGLRRARSIAASIEKNLNYLKLTGWDELLPIITGLQDHHTQENERSAARSLSSVLNGIGPKQSRNLLQSLGLTQHEIPLDSRIVKWLNESGFPIRLSAGGLSDHDYYEFIMDGIQELCRKADILPCVFDALVFASFDEDAWESGSMY